MEELYQQQDKPDNAQTFPGETSAPAQDNTYGIMGDFSSPPLQTINSPMQPLEPSRDANTFFGDAQSGFLPYVPMAAQVNTAASATMEAAPIMSRQSATGGVTEALQKQIDARTSTIDNKTKEKEVKQKEAAESYLKEENAKREIRLKGTREAHAREQEMDEAKRKDYKKSGAVWSSVGMLADFNKTNSYSKNTERMRSILTRLCASESA